MKYVEYEYGGEKYRCRVVADKSGDELIIGSTKFLDALQPGNLNVNDGFTDKEAEHIYDEIFFFVNQDEIDLDDDALVKILKESNPEWFEDESV